MTVERVGRSEGPIFIGGLMKSGTSLLRKLLSRHPRIYGGLETHWFAPDITEKWQDPTSRRQIWLAQFFDVSDTELARIRAEAASGTDFVDRFMWYCTRRAGKARWVEKTPDNVLHIATIDRVWPDAQFIFVVRDFRDIFASWKRNGKAPVDGFIAQVHAVMRAVGPRAGTRSESYLEVDYDALVTDTEQTLRRVLGFLGEPWVDGFHVYEGDDWDHQKVLKVTGRDGATARALAKPIFTSSLGQWREVLTSAEVERIQGELGPYMALWGWK
jgi:hypothetical protein